MQGFCLEFASLRLVDAARPKLPISAHSRTFGNSGAKPASSALFVRERALELFRAKIFEFVEARVREDMIEDMLFPPQRGSRRWLELEQDLRKDLETNQEHNHTKDFKSVH